MKIKQTAYEHIFEIGKHFPQCHASTIIKTSDGALLAAWFAGTRESHPDVSIWISKRVKGRWSTPLQLVKSEGVPCWNPVLSKNAAGRLFLYYKVGSSPIAWHTRFVYSDDAGNSWTMPEELVKGDLGGRGPVKNKCILLSSGDMLAPASIETEQAWDAFVDRSADGIHYKKSSLVPLHHTGLTGKGIIQPTLWESQPGTVHMLLRSTEGFIYRSDSADDGQTWSFAYPTLLPNNNSGIDLVKVGDILVLVHNPVGKNWGPRSPIVLSLSADNGTSWEEALVLDHNEAPVDKHDGEFSYPAIIAEGNTLYITYTWKRRTVAFWEVQCVDD